ncbi:MAG: hypothetical protein K5675_03940 [Lachnospiraceae bacterium]|nr:hypothetical protein [Lachnospiraceae bacterium]
MSSYNFGTTSGIAGMLGDYYSIQNGSYSKLMTSYYSSVETTDSSGSSSSKKTSVLDQILEERKNPTVSTEVASANSTLSSAVENLKSDVQTLQNASTYEDTTGGSSARAKVATALQGYVTDYNSAVEASKKSSMSTVSSNIAAIQSASSENADALKEIGITINNDGTLTLNEKALDTIDLSKVEELFSTEDSLGYGSSVSSRITRANYYVSETESTTDTTATTSSSSDLKSAVEAILSDDASFSDSSALSLAKDLVKYYNSAISSASSSTVSGVTSNLGSLLQKTSNNANLLSTIGISVGSSGSLSIDTDTFNSADEATKQSVLQKYASSIESNASLMYYYSSTGNSTSSSYSSSGSYYTSSSDLISSLYSTEA